MEPETRKCREVEWFVGLRFLAAPGRACLDEYLIISAGGLAASQQEGRSWASTP